MFDSHKYRKDNSYLMAKFTNGTQSRIIYFYNFEQQKT